MPHQSSSISSKHHFTPRMMLHDIQALKGRSRMIGRLKYTLPGIALMALLALIGWPQIQKWMHGHKPTLAQTTPLPQTSITATRPEYKSTDNKNQPYTITADHGVETSFEKIQLTSPKMIMTLKSGGIVTLTATSGDFNKATNKMHLVGNVILTHSQGYNLHTSQAWIDCNEGDAFSTTPILGDGPAGTIEANGFRLTEKGAKISLIGKAKLYLNGPKNEI